MVLLRLTIAEAVAAAALLAGSLAESFQNPPRQYSLMPYWYWNSRITEEETRRQIREMMAQGVYRAIVFPWDGMEPEYLSEQYWRQVGAALEIARELGFTLNFADELNWPSGHAWRSSGPMELSRVLEQRPDFRMRRLAFVEYTVQGSRRWRLKAGTPPQFAVAAAQDEAGRLDTDSLRLLQPRGRDIVWDAPPGRWLVTVYRLVPAVGAHNTRVDLLNPEAVRLYLDLVYEEFARRFPEHLGRTLKLTVADHEGSYGSPIAWTPRLFDEFQRRKGYDLRVMLPLLIHDATRLETSRKLRIDYFDVISELYERAFTSEVTQWCRRHGLLHGVSLYEEQLWIQVAHAGDMFRHWRAGSLIMIDALLERARMPLDFKEAVSVAHFERMPLLVENQGLQGHDSFLSPEKMRRGTNMCLLWGAEALVPYFDYDTRKITWPPQWFRGQPFWRYFRRYADYVRRAQFMNAQGQHVAPVAVYYPLETAFAHGNVLVVPRRRELEWGNFMDQVQNFYSALQLELSRGGWDYHILDRHYLRQASIEGRTLRLADEEFRVLVLPPMSEMDQEAARKVRAFHQAGGVVLALGPQPSELDGVAIQRFPVREHPPFMHRLDYVRPTVTPESVRQDLEPLLKVLRTVEPPPVEILSGEGTGFYFSRRRTNSAEWFWAVNDSGEERDIRVRMPAPGAWEKWDAETGARCMLGEGRELILRFGPWDAFFLVRGADARVAPCVEWRVREARTLSSDGWTFTPEAERIRVPYAVREDSGELLWLAPEREGQRGWWLIGPFPHDDHLGFFRPQGPERRFRRKAQYQGAFERVRWRWVESPSYQVIPAQALGLRGDRGFGVYYAFVHVYSPQARQARIVTAFADSLRLWWNGREVLSVHRHPKWLLLRDAWAETVTVQLRRGWNRLLLKLGPSLMVPTAFMLRLTGEDGAVLRDVVFAPEKKLPPPQTQQLRLRVEVPPGAVAVWQDGEQRPRRPDERFVVIETQGRVPENAVAFLTGTVAFRLASWTDSALRHYSGTAIYETEFELSEEWLGRRVLLDLGEVGVAAEVWVNGQHAGVRLWRPFRFDISSLVRPRNRLRIRVANSDAGWQAQGDTIYPRGSWGLDFATEHDRLARLRPNGLEGPVRVIAPE